MSFLKSIKTSFDENLNMNEMEMKARLIVDDIKNEEGTSPVAIFKRMAKKEGVYEKCQSLMLGSVTTTKL